MADEPNVFQSIGQTIVDLVSPRSPRLTVQEVTVGGTREVESAPAVKDFFGRALKDVPTSSQLEPPTAAVVKSAPAAVPPAASDDSGPSELPRKSAAADLKDLLHGSPALSKISEAGSALNDILQPILPEAYGATNAEPLASEHAQHERYTAAVCRVQQAFRLRQLLFRDHGPSLFSMNNGRAAAHGELFFVGATSARPFIVVSETTSIPLLATFLSKYWALPKPEVLITVTGGAMDFALTSAQLAAFDYGLYTAASSTNAWVVSAGSDAGVMKIVGKALRGQSAALPLIGIFPIGVTHGREPIVASRGRRVVSYSPPPKPIGAGAKLNPDHTHFVLVDNGKEGVPAFGGEIQVRAALEAYVAHSKGVPIVQLVVQGGPGTVATVRATAEALNPIVVLTDSGGAAEAIFEYVVNGALPERLAKFESQQSHLDAIKAAHERSGAVLLTFAKLEDGNQLATAMLTAVLKMFSQKDDKQNDAKQQPTLPRRQKSQPFRHGEDDRIAKMIMLAVSWKRPEMVQSLLSQLSAKPADDNSNKPPPLARALQRAFELLAPDIVLLLFEFAGDKLVPHISMARLYLRCIDQDLDGHRYLQKDKAQRAYLFENTKAIDDSKTTREAQLQLYRGFFLPVIGKITFMLESVVASSLEVGVNDLFYWAIFMGSDELAYLLWQECDKPAHTALIGSIICKAVARQTSPGQAKTRMLERAKRMEKWAVGVLDHSVDEKMAKDILSTTLVENQQYHLSDLALHGKMKHFLAHQCCVSYMELEWRGGYFGSSFCLPDDYSYFIVLLDMLFPIRFMFDFLWKRQVAVDDAPHEPTITLDLALEAQLRSKVIGAQQRRIAKSSNDPADGLELEESTVEGESDADPEGVIRSTLRRSGTLARQATIRLTKTKRITKLIDATRKRSAYVADSRIVAFYKCASNPENSRQRPVVRLPAHPQTHPSSLAANRVPCVGHLGRVMAHLLWLGVYFWVILTTPTRDQLERALDNGDYLGTWYLDMLWYIFHVGNFLDQRHLSLKLRFHCNLVADSWSKVWLIVDFFFCIAATTRILAENVTDKHAAKQLFVSYQVLVSITGGLVCILTMRYFSRWRPFGMLVTALEARTRRHPQTRPPPRDS